jgi:GTP-binding protein YchF
MAIRCGIVGLPNVGKSTLFNALTQTAAAQAANYPFCTIEPNVGNVAVPDARLQALASIAKSQKIIETQLGFTDIAGLVRGASKGEGLGNQFLANIRETDAIVHVLRCFEDDDVTHVDGRIDPVADAETVETELMLADLESLERRVPALAKKAAQGDKQAKIEASVLGAALELLREGKPARLTEAKDDEEVRALKLAQLLTTKPVLYVCNVDEAHAADGNAHSAAVAAMAARIGAGAVVVSAAIEAEIATMEPADRQEYLESLGLRETGLARRGGDIHRMRPAGPLGDRVQHQAAAAEQPHAAAPAAVEGGRPVRPIDGERRPVSAFQHEALAFQQGDGAVMAGVVGEVGILVEEGEAQQPARATGDIRLAAEAVGPAGDGQGGEGDHRRGSGIRQGIRGRDTPSAPVRCPAAPPPSRPRTPCGRAR